MRWNVLDERAADIMASTHRCPVLWPPHAVWWGFADMRLNRKGGSDHEGLPALWQGTERF